jgi:hypothetical protein
MGTPDPVRDFLKKKGCAEHVVEGGLRGLVETWEGVVESVKRGYDLGLDDYLNDLDGRQLLEETLAIAPKEQKEESVGRVRRADELMKTLVKPAGKCLWGDEVAETEGWTSEKNWWYFTRPIQADPEFLFEIDGV